MSVFVVVTVTTMVTIIMNRDYLEVTCGVWKVKNIGQNNSAYPFSVKFVWNYFEKFNFYNAFHSSKMKFLIITCE